MITVQQAARVSTQSLDWLCQVLDAAAQGRVIVPKSTDKRRCREYVTALRKAGICEFKAKNGGWELVLPHTSLAEQAERWAAKHQHTPAGKLYRLADLYLMLRAQAEDLARPEFEERLLNAFAGAVAAQVKPANVANFVRAGLENPLRHPQPRSDDRQSQWDRRFKDS